MKICHAIMYFFSRCLRRGRPALMQSPNLAVVAKAELPRILAHAKVRGWRWMRLLSSAGNTYNRDYLASRRKSPDADAQRIPARRE